MTPIESADFGVLAAFAAMAVATYAMRAGGFWMMQHVPPSPRLRKMLNALPGSVIVAAVLPIIVRDGMTAILAIGAAMAAMLLTRRDIVAVVAGLTVAIAARAAGW
jgi:branched chain amino acid efflux pump